MSLAPGTRLGPYEITAPIGAGGMGEVYRARDTKLHRSVAIKALPDSFASDSGRLSRFEREARVLASLNHPHIAQIYGLEAQDTRSFIVMELVEGETLTEWIARQPKPPIDEALLIARQIAEALEAAHEQGIIHRDLKPANIKVKSDGTVKVLDFGLARADGAANAADNERARTNSPTMTSPAMTQAGVILGTAAYMAPEQAKGKPVDKRADIWAFGCVLFEMLTGRPVFHRETVTETLAAVMRDAPPFDALAATTPTHVRRLLGRCLERDPKRRLRDIGEARLVLEGGSEGIDVPVLLAAGSARRPRWLTVLPWAVALASIATLVGVERSRRMPPPGAPPLSKIVVPLPEALIESGRPIIALSPNGHRLAFVAPHDRTSAIYLRDVDGFDARPLADTENANSIFFSPDGEWIGFYASGRLKKVSVRGGPPVTLASTTEHLGATWTRSGTIITTTGTPGLIEVPEGGGESRAIAPSKAMLQKSLPYALPDGRTVLYATESQNRQRSVSARRLDSDEEKQLVVDAGHPSYFDGYLLFARGGTLFATRFDADRLEVSGTPVPVLEGVLFSPAAATAQYAISTNGRLAYVPAAAQSGRLLSAVDRSGVVVALSDVRHRFFMPRVSPDGRRIAVTLEIDGAYSIWILDIATGTLSQVVDVGMDPVWSPDGRRLVFSTPRSTGTALQIIAADRSSAATDLLTDTTTKVPTSWSRDDKWIAFTRVQEGSATGEDVFLIAPDGSGLHPLVQGPGNQDGGVFSPDGRWLAYTDADVRMVFVSPVANATQRQRVDTDGAIMPQWSPDGRELFFLGRQFDQLLGAAVSPGPDGLQFAKPTLVAQVRMGSGIGFGLQRYDVMPDGRRFVFATADVASPPTQIRIVLDFGLQLASLLRR